MKLFISIFFVIFFNVLKKYIKPINPNKLNIEIMFNISNRRSL